MQDRLVIAFDAKRLFHNNTGLGNYARTLLRNLVRYFPNHSYHLFTPSIKNVLPEASVFLEPPFIVHHNTTLLPDAIWRSWYMSTIINTIGAHVYHGLSHELPFGITGKTKKVVTMHDLIYEARPELFPWIDRWSYHFKYMSACNRADGIIAISNHTKDDLKKYYDIDHKVNVIYQSCHHAFYTQAPPPIKETRHMLYVGSISPRKGLLYIVKAYALLPAHFRIPFVVVGEGGSYKQQVMDEIKKLDLGSYFIFKNNVPNHDLVSLYDHAAALVYPSLYEGFGIPIIEAAWRSCPVITSYNSSLVEAAGPHSLYVDQQDIGGLAEAMQIMLNPKIAEEKGLASYQYTSKQYESKHLTEKLIEYYTSLS